MNGYICFYKGKRLEVWADRSFDAQQQAAKHFKAKKAHEVAVMLAEKDSKPVVHTPTE